MALALADWDGFPNRRAEARECGKLHRQLCRDHQRRPSRAHRNHATFPKDALSWRWARCRRDKDTKPALRSSSLNGSACRPTSRLPRRGLGGPAIHPALRIRTARYAVRIIHPALRIRSRRNAIRKIVSSERIRFRRDGVLIPLWRGEGVIERHCDRRHESERTEDDRGD
jgi:hypothetical protein